MAKFLLFLVWRYKSILRNSTFGRRGVDAEFSRSSVGVLRQGIREEKETVILIKVLFCNLEFFGSSLVLISPKGFERLFRLWFILGLLPEEDV